MLVLSNYHSLTFSYYKSKIEFMKGYFMHKDRLKQICENKKIDNIIVVLPEDEVKYFKENILNKLK